GSKRPPLAVRLYGWSKGGLAGSEVRAKAELAAPHLHPGPRAGRRDEPAVLRIEGEQLRAIALGEPHHHPRRAGSRPQGAGGGGGAGGEAGRGGRTRARKQGGREQLALWRVGQKGVLGEDEHLRLAVSIGVAHR